MKKKEHVIGERKVLCWAGKLRDCPTVVKIKGPTPQQFIIEESKGILESDETPVIQSKPVKANEEEQKVKKDNIKILNLQDQLQEYDEMLDSYICPLSFTLMEDPVTAEDGQTYEREDIEEWLKTTKKSPVTGEEMKSKKLVPNSKTKQEIEDLKGKIKEINEKIATLKMKEAEI